MEGLAKKLFDDGTVVIPLLAKQHVDTFRSTINEEIVNGPEVVKDLKVNVSELVGGSFGAIGSPSSFHSKGVRILRRKTYDILIRGGFCQDFAGLTGRLNVEMLADRYRVQSVGTKVGGEKYHRDESSNAKEKDVILGGWINLSNQTVQYFSCLVGTQLQTNKKRGFSKQNPTSEQLKNYKKFTVNPGQLVLFYQNIMHQVNGTTLKDESVRLHVGFRFTNSSKQLFPLEKVFENFEPFQLPSGQDARMWPKLWWTNWPKKLEALAQLYVPELQEERVLKKDPSVKRIIIPEVLKLIPSMRQHFIPYGEEERKMYTPRRLKKKHSLPELDNKRKREREIQQVSVKKPKGE